MALPLDVAPLTFLGPSSMWKRLFEKGFWVSGERS